MSRGKKETEQRPGLVSMEQRREKEGEGEGGRERERKREKQGETRIW